MVFREQLSKQLSRDDKWPEWARFRRNLTGTIKYGYIPKQFHICHLINMGVTKMD